MLRDLRAAKDDQAEAALAVILKARADVLLLLDVDWDHGGQGVRALTERLADAGLRYDYHVALQPVTGIPSDFDLDGNGAIGEARDALGYGRFTGDSGLVLLSRHPLGPVTDLSRDKWIDHGVSAAELLPAGAEAVMPLATVAQWVVPLRIGDEDISLITMAAGTPVYDGPEDRNGRRNLDELTRVAELAAQWPRPVVLGRANIDPADGQGLQEGITALLNHPNLSDPQPRGQGGGGDGHRGDPARDTVAWEGPGPLRVDYVLPARTMDIRASGIVWPAADDPFLKTVETAGPGRLVWVDLVLP